MTEPELAAQDEPTGYVGTWSVPGGSGFQVVPTQDFGIAIVSHPDMGSLVTVSPDLVETLSAFLVEAQQAVNTPNRLKPKRVDSIMTWSVRDFGGVDVSVRTDGMIELAPWNTSDRLHPTIAPESVDTLIALLRYAAVVANEQVRPSDTL